MGAVRLVVAALVLALSSTAFADDKEAARKAYLEGVKHYNLNEIPEALAAFRRAYWSYEDPSFLYNIAQCHRALKHKSEAVDFYRSYLRNAPNAPNRAEVLRVIVELETAISQEKALASGAPQGTLGEGSHATAPPPPTGTASAPPPPTGTASAPPPAPVLVAQPVAGSSRADRPLWKRGWFWGVVAGAAVVVAVGVGVGVGVGTASPRDPKPSIGMVQVN